jgi:hypothetical protein
MSRTVFLFAILIAISTRYVTCAFVIIENDSIAANESEQDTLLKRQILYNGILWENRYHRIKNYQFLFSDLFLPGTVTINGKTFNNVGIKYDIYSDEILIPKSREEILQLNKEMVDSFTISFESKEYRFTNIRADTLKGFKGYMNVLYKGKSALYVKYKKNISFSDSQQYDGGFYQTSLNYFLKDSIVYQIKSANDLFKILNANSAQIKSFIKSNKLKISKKVPESYVPIIRYYDSIGQ